MKSEDQKNIDQLSLLLNLSMEGMITDAQFEQLQNILIKDPTARAYYYDFISSYLTMSSMELFSEIPFEESAYLDPNLWSELSKAESSSPAISTPKIKEEGPVQFVKPNGESHKISKLSWASLILSAAAVVLIALFVRFAPVKEDQSLIAKLTNSLDARWENVSGDLPVGCNLNIGPMKLKSGFAEIKMDSGADVIIEAPAQFSLESPTQIYLQQGRLVVKVNSHQDQGNSFVVRSTQTSIVDYGTEFGVEVDHGNNTLTYVYQGKVELRSGPNPLRFEDSLLLTQDEGGVADINGKLASKRGIENRFVRKQEFEIKVKAAKGSNYHRWLAYSYQLRRDPDVVAYYTFERDDKNANILINQAGATSGQLDGTLRSADNSGLPTWESGRWTQKTALSFNRDKNQQVEIPSDMSLGINGPITIAAWVDCSGVEDGGHIVSNRVGVRSQINYQFGYRSPWTTSWDQGMHLARKTDSKDANNQVCSKDLSEVSGWVLIAATHDNETLKFYLNGSLVDSIPWSHKQSLVKGGLMIGTDYSPDDPSRFNGKIGEIMIAKRVFTDEEITEMYEAGKP